MSNPFLSILASVLSVAFAPVKTHLKTAETDPQAALSGLANLAAAEIGNLPAIENAVIEEGAQLMLNLIADIEAKLAGTAAPVAAAPAPVVP